MRNTIYDLIFVFFVGVTINETVNSFKAGEYSFSILFVPILFIIIFVLGKLSITRRK